jgi:hypothetical protein
VAGFFTNKQGDISVVRIGLLAGGLGLLAIIIGIIFWNLEHHARKSPFNVAPYPNMVEVRRVDHTPYQRTILYQAVGDADQIATYYQAQLDNHLNQRTDDPMRNNTHILCVRVPVAGNFSDYAPNNGKVPFYHRCGFDNSFYGSHQSTMIEIQPGVMDVANDVDYTGTVWIIYEQRWSR